MTEIIEEFLERFSGTIFAIFAGVRSTWNDLERLERFASKSLIYNKNKTSICGTILPKGVSFSTSFVPLVS